MVVQKEDEEEDTPSYLSPKRLEEYQTATQALEKRMSLSRSTDGFTEEGSITSVHPRDIAAALKAPAPYARPADPNPKIPVYLLVICV